MTEETKEPEIDKDKADTIMTRIIQEEAINLKTKEKNDGSSSTNVE